MININVKDNEFPDINDEIDFKSLFNFFIRNKRVLISFSSIFFVFFCIFSLTQKKIWEGTFQIVLNTKNEKSDLSNLFTSENRSLAGLIGIGIGGSVKNQLKTEVGILESPSVLLPVFDFFKNQKKISNPKEIEMITFKGWKEKKLDIGLKKDTTILDIAYRDTDKEIIIPVLKEISSVYQQYSGESKRRSIQLGKNYLSSQINKYKNKSNNSLRAAQKYAMEQDLEDMDSSVQFFGGQNKSQNDNLGFSKDSFLTVGIEVLRAKAANEIRKIDVQIKKINDAKNQQNVSDYIAISLPELIDEGLADELTILDARILSLQSRYTDDFEGLMILKEKRKNLIRLMGERTIGFLRAKKIRAESILESATRPKEIILNYKELMREAARDEATLVELENQYRVTQLQEARIQEPWKLITNPTLKTYPVGLSRSLIGILGGIFGLLIGVSFAFIKELKNGLIYKDQDLEKLLEASILDKINLNKSDKNNVFLNSIIRINNYKKIRFIKSIEIQEEKLLKFKKLISISSDKEVIFNQLNNISEEEILIFLTESEKVTFDEIENLKNKLEAIKMKFAGIVILCD